MESKKETDRTKTRETQEKQGSLCQWQTTWQTHRRSQQPRSSRWRISRFSPQKKCSSRGLRGEAVWPEKQSKAGKGRRAAHKVKRGVGPQAGAQDPGGGGAGQRARQGPHTSHPRAKEKEIADSKSARLGEEPRRVGRGRGSLDELVAEAAASTSWSRKKRSSCWRSYRLRQQWAELQPQWS